MEIKKIDKEHAIIEKIFRISLTEKERFIYLELFHAQLLSLGIEEAFRIQELDNIILSILQNEERKADIVNYLLETYHRAFEMIEKRYKHELEEKYSSVRKIIASYLSLILSSPEMFELSIGKEKIKTDLTKYYNETEDEELEFLFTDIIQTTYNNFENLSEFFSHFFKLLHTENQGQNFYKNEKIARNLKILNKLLTDHNITRLVYVQESNFNPNGINGKAFQSTPLGIYLSLVTFESDINSIKSVFNSSNQKESDIQMQTQSKKMNAIMDEVASLINTLLVADHSQNETLNFFYELVNVNIERLKMYSNPFNTSTIGLLLNSALVLLKIFFKNCDMNDLFSIVSNIDISFCMSTNRINFNKFDRVNQERVKDILSAMEDTYNTTEYNISTKLFFIIHSLLAYTLKTLDDEYGKLSNQFGDLVRNNAFSDPKFKELLGIVKALEAYLYNSEFMKNIFKFSEITSILIFTLNNKKYFQNIQNIDLNNFADDFYNHIDSTDITSISLLPLAIIKNTIQSALITRKYQGDILVSDMLATKILIYYSLIYSSQIEIINNPHLRSEIFDILIYFFIIYSGERNSNKSDDFIKENLIISLMRVFIDAERLGTANQFYEKFSIRHKIFYLIENIMKSHKGIYTDKIIEYANNYTEDTTKMVTLLMNDLTFLSDECIERLIEIKRYQDLTEDVNKYNSLDEETKQLEDNKFKDNDRRVRTELKLLNTSMNFMNIMTQCCQANFMNYKLGEKLANLLNYSLDVFTSNKQLQLKIKNMSDYGFDPKYLLVSLVKIYTYFYNYPEFLEFIVKDQRSFKIVNFEKVVLLKESEKIYLDYNIYETFKSLIDILKKLHQDIKANEINYDDASEEFLDPITNILMDDPVMLPSSKNIVDRSTIETHLLSDASDPFNRTSLSKELLIPCPELKAQIENYKKTKI